MRYTKIFLLLLAASVVTAAGCKKEAPKDEAIVKYARYSAAVYNDSEMTKWAATLAKTEPVFFIESLKVTIQGKPVDVSKVNLSDYTTVYIKSKHLGNQPVVFTEDTKAYVRNNQSSSIYTTIPKGTIGFIEKESAEWSQIYAGKINNKWLTKQWVRGGFSNEESLIREARMYEESIAVLEKSSSKPGKKKEALDRLKELSSSQIFSVQAGDALSKYSSAATGEDTKVDEKTEPGTKGKFAVVISAKGLKIRRGPGTEEEEIAVIPSGGSVEIIGSEDAQVTIAGKTSRWYEVKWRDEQGWVFGGFLEIE